MAIEKINFNCNCVQPMKFNDCISEYEFLCKVIATVNGIVDFVNNLTAGAINDYVEKYFENIMIGAIYEEETETIKFGVQKGDQ